MLLLGIDVETTGLSATNDSIIEIGAVLWHWETQSPIQIFSELIKEPYLTLPLSDKIIEITGISTGLVTSYGKAFKEYCYTRLNKLIHHASFLVAHNASFDKKFMEALYDKNNLSFPEKQWICTFKDITYPKEIKSKALANLAQTHSITNPFPHRAVFDVLTMFQVMQQYKKDISEIIHSSSFPLIEIEAQVSYEDREQAKEHGFYWNKDNKTWQKSIRQNKLELEKENYPFAIKYKK